MALKGYTIIEYNGADGRVAYKSPDGTLHSSRKLSALLSNIRKSLQSKAQREAAKQLRAAAYAQKAESDFNDIKSIKELKRQNLKLIEPFIGVEHTYNIHCEKHNITLARRLSNIEPSERKIKAFCPECRKEEYVQYYNSLGVAPNITIKKYRMEDGNSRKKMECQCNFCNHIFERIWDEIKKGSNDCPMCGLYRRKNLPHLYDKYEVYRSECDSITQTNITRFSNILIPIDNMSIDHRFSCRNGYDNHIPPWIVAMPYNLEWIAMVDNTVKHKKNSMTLGELLIRFGEFIKEHPWYAASFDKSFGK
jgi:transcription elongation factor Elf1